MIGAFIRFAFATEIRFSGYSPDNVWFFTAAELDRLMRIGWEALVNVVVGGVL